MSNLDQVKSTEVLRATPATNDAIIIDDLRSEDYIALSERVRKTFDRNGRSMRSVGGIARETGLSRQAVEEILNRHPGVFERVTTLTPGGSTLYALKAE